MIELDYPHRDLSSSPGYLSLPQNPTRMTTDQPGAIRGSIGGMLTDACANFINKLISAQTGKAYDSKTQLLTDFDKVTSGKGGLFWGGNRGGGENFFGRSHKLLPNRRVVLQKLLHSDYRADQCKFSGGVIATHHAHQFSLLVIDRAARETIPRIEFRRPVLEAI